MFTEKQSQHLHLMEGEENMEEGNRLKAHG